MGLMCTWRCPWKLLLVMFWVILSAPRYQRGQMGKVRPLQPPNNLSGVSSKLCHPCQGAQATVLVTLVVSLGRCFLSQKPKRQNLR